MRITLGVIIGATTVIVWLYTWRALIGYALSRGDS